MFVFPTLVTLGGSFIYIIIMFYTFQLGNLEEIREELLKKYIN